MANQCCCKDYNSIPNCIGCDSGSGTSYTVTASVTGFTDTYACDLATHVNRTLVHDFGSIADTAGSVCRNTLIVGNQTPPDSWCEGWCPASSLHQAPNLDQTTNCYPDSHIDAELPATVVSQSPFGTYINWECRCRDLCEYNKTIYRGPAAGYTAPTCHLTIWYTVDFKYNSAIPANSKVEYYISFFLADTYKTATSINLPCDDGGSRFCFDGTILPNLVLLTFGGEETYDADQLCSAINIDVPLCPWRGEFQCDWEKPEIPENSNLACLPWEYLCGYPLDFSSANVNLTVNVS